MQQKLTTREIWLRQQREAKTATRPVASTKAATKPPVAPTKPRVDTSVACPACAARRKAKAQAQARWRARKAAKGIA